MANGQTFTLNFDAKLNVAQMKGAIGSIQSELNRLQLPQNLTKGITGTLTSLEKELRNFEVAAGKDLGQKNNFSAFAHSAERISSLFKDLQIQARDLGQGISLDKFFPQDVIQTINQARTALKNYEAEVDKLNRKVSSQKGQVTKTLANQIVAKDNLDTAKDQLDKITSDYQQTLTDLFNRVKIDPKNIIDQGSIDQAIAEAQKRIERLQQIQNNVNAKGQPYKYADSTKEKAKAEEAALAGLIAKYNELREAQAQQSATIQKLQTAYDTATNKVKAAQVALQEFENAAKAGTSDAFNKLVTELNKLGIDTTGVTNIEQAKAALAEFSKTAEGEAAAALEKLRSELERQRPTFDTNADAVRQSAEAYKQFNDSLRDVSAVKSRIQYFFGLNNAINLVKRAIRGAVDTVKELDKAMTETAVVTNYTISDMWKQLPDYTKRANELGVTTKDAYEAATLYYQQGLNTEQAAALSAETLKMARIAGLEAADATDRMTNALRGFNMELNAMSAQRVDDVYSQLAAMSASNVDEISTAMTKVASLAHSANMEFETTAAFLAQIIETTRESAETAGTALKTVVARFSEVKKLVDEDQLKGADEEGQVIDVNKVSQALRTAGIDLNKYFIGEVGLDDIFIELASKWDSLTSVQQRYIATQAAGSRQQSRFIALMQDYARTQQLVSAAYNANGASAKQFEKTQESLQSKLARLKNAWDQFLMGLTNNAVIKTAVDLLTGLLNIVNNLTEAFGTGVGSILKWIAVISAFSGIKGLFAGGGLIDKSLMTVLNGTGIGNAAIKSGILSGALFGNRVVPGSDAAQAITGTTGNMVQRTPLIFGSGSLLSKAGKGLWGGAKNLGAFLGFGQSSGALMGGLSGAQLTGSAGLAAGLGGMATAIGAIGAAMAAAYGIYQLWLHNSAEGKLKLATEEAKKLQEAAQEAQDQYKSLQNFQDTYQGKTEQVSNATTTAEREQAILDRNQAILDAIEQDGTLAKYVVTEKTDFGIQLTIDEAALKSAIADIGDAAKKAAIDAQFGEARVDLAEANVAEKQLRKMYSLQFMYSTDAQELSIEEIYERLRGDVSISAKDQSRAAELYSSILNERASGETKARIAYGESLTGLGASKELTNALMPVLADVFSKNQKQISDDNLKSIIDLNESLLLPLLNAYSGTGEAAEVNLSDLSENATKEEVFKRLGIDSQADRDELAKLATDLGIGIKDLEKTIVNRAKENQKLQQQRKANIYSAALSNDIDLTTDFQNRVAELSPKITEMISGVIDSASEVLSQKGMQDLIPSLLDLDESQLTQFQDFFNNFNLDSPISAFDALNNAKEKALAGTPFATMLDNIAEANKELFTTSNLVQNFMTSESYDSLTESLESFIKENGQISSKNIKDLAENCNQLQILLDQTTVSAQGLAEAFTLYENGTITIDAMTSSLLAAFSAGESFNTLMSNVSEWIEGFSEGPDMAQGTEHIIDVLNKAEEYISDFQFGNKPLANIYDHIFGKDAYKDYMEANYGEESFDEIQKYLQGKVDEIRGWAENEGKGALDYLAENNLSGITQVDDGTYEWNLEGYETASQAVSDIADSLNVTDEVARAFIESWGSHMYDLGQAWDELNFEDSITAFNEALGDSAVITEQELTGLVALTGKEKDEILSAIEAIRGEGNVPIVVSWQDENGASLTGSELIQSFNKEVLKMFETNFETTGGMVNRNLGYDKILEGLQDDLNNIDLDGLREKLINVFKLTPNQANEVANDIVKTVDGQFTKEVEIPVITTYEENGETIVEVTSDTKKIVGNTVEQIEAAEQAIQGANLQSSIATILANGQYNGLTDSVVGALEDAAQRGAEKIQEAINAINASININIAGGFGGIADFILGKVGFAATGGIVNSYANGSRGFRIKPGPALTGEEDPELVWNKNEGYAYITGQNGPEFQNLKPGDRVFNASETKQILKNSKTNFKYPSFWGGKPPKSTQSSSKKATGNWGEGSGSAGANNNGSKSSKDTQWQNTLDWLYNLMEDIAELERLQEQLSEKHERYLEDISKTGRDLYNLTNDELNNLLTQRDNYQEALTRRMQEMREQVEASEVSQYAWWNDDDNTIEIDWDAINEITDKDKYDEVTDLISKLEKIQDQMDEAEEALWDIEGQIIELKNRYLEEFIDFQKRVYDAIVDSYQKQIDALEVLNDTINDSDSQILNSLQKEIDLQRQIRDNTEAEENIRDLEARLAYLRRDTSGANDAEIRQLEKELEDARKSYTDDLIDQALDRLQESSNEAAEQRQKQIDLLTEQLDYWKEIGAFWPEVAKLIDEGINGEGSLIRGSTLEEILKQADNWKAMSEEQKQVWADDLIKEVNQAGAYLITIAEGLDNLSAGIWALIPESSIPGGTYATGGLATVTGPAWLDGTPSEPEYVLNARQTDAFLRLADVLPSIFGNNDGIVNNNNGNTYIELNMNVGEIGSDYDVDRLVDRLKDDLYNASAYRNVNAINFLR